MNQENERVLLAGRLISGAISARIILDGREYLNFFGSGYLALASVPEVLAAVQAQLSRGGAFSRQVPAALGAIEPVFQEVERLAAVACGAEASIYLPSGYLIGMAGMASLEGSSELLLLDELAHYSLKDAAPLSGSAVCTFAHCDVDSLADQLRRETGHGRRPLVLTDGIFATTGRLPPLQDYASVLASYDGRLLIDESHAFGVVGEQGQGAAELCGVQQVSVRGATLSKAYCAQGAVLACSSAQYRKLCEAPVIRGACSGSPLSAAAASAALTYVSKRPQLRAELRKKAEYLRARLRGIGIEMIDSPAPIVSFTLGTAPEMKILQQRLFERGIHIYHSHYIGAGTEGVIRCAVFRDHSTTDLDTLVDAIQCATPC